ncbi:MAG: hypothetical protein J2P47_05730 [Acetobacteraceae bacterium]|nr:hypothetical protein [Acetobacteraceae bacterium]
MSGDIVAELRRCVKDGANPCRHDYVTLMEQAADGLERQARELERISHIAYAAIVKGTRFAELEAEIERLREENGRLYGELESCRTVIEGQRG